MLIFGICDILIRIIKIYDKQREKQFLHEVNSIYDTNI